MVLQYRTPSPLGPPPPRGRGGVEVKRFSEANMKKISGFLVMVLVLSIAAFAQKIG
jgi:hypothetical protein